jgi:hypothetical protein
MRIWNVMLRGSLLQAIARACPTLIFAALSFASQSTQPVPVFSSEDIRRSSKLLAAGMVWELYGQNLAAQQTCGAANPPYSTEICGVRVLVGSTAAELMYVSSGQINLKVRADAPDEGLVPFRVCVGEVCSEPVMMRFSKHTALLSQEGPVYVHMPVWIRLDPPFPHHVYYPCGDWPWSFPQYEFEVRRNGRNLTPLPQPAAPASVGIAHDTRFCEPSRGLFPLHLLYRFDEAGTYAVRLTARNGPEVLYQSDWTDVQIEPFSERKREELLRSLEAKIQTADVKFAIASLLSWPDEKALAVLLKAIPVNTTRCRNYECVRLFFGKAALAGFDESLLRGQVPRERLLVLCPPDGKCR